MKEEAMNHRMRIYQNGPGVEEFCSRKLHGTETTYHPGALCKESQALYRNDVGKRWSKRQGERDGWCKRQAKILDGEKTAISTWHDKNKQKMTGMKIGHMAHHSREKWKQTTKRKDALDNQATKRHFIETMLQPGAGAKMKVERNLKHKDREAKRKTMMKGQPGPVVLNKFLK